VTFIEGHALTATSAEGAHALPSTEAAAAPSSSPSLRARANSTPALSGTATLLRIEGREGESVGDEAVLLCGEDELFLEPSSASQRRDALEENRTPRPQHTLRAHGHSK
jgi:hypothetical protein